MKLNTDFLLQRCTDLVIMEATKNGTGYDHMGVATIYALMAIANELRRTNDMREEDRDYEAYLHSVNEDACGKGG